MSASLATQDPREIVLVHEISLFPEPAILFRYSPDVFFLVFGEDELGSPSSLTSASFPLAARIPSHGLGDAVAVPSVVPLHVLLQVHSELSIGFRGARHASQCIIAAARTEFFGHVFRDEETGVAALNERLEVSNPLQGGSGQEVQVHLEKDVLALFSS